MSNVYTWSTTAATNNSAAPNGAPEGMTPSAVNNVIRENMKTIADWRDFLGGAKTTSGTDTITLTSGLSITAYAAGQMFVAKLGGTNTGAATINIDSVGAVAVEINGAAVAAGDFTSGKYVLFIYDGTAFQATKLSAADFSTAASETVSGIVELATTTEASTGVDTARAVTAAGVAAAIAAQATSGATDAEKSNIMLNSFRIEEQGGLTVQGMVDGVSDVFTDESGVDTATSTDEVYNAAGDYYENPGNRLTAAADFTGGTVDVTLSPDGKIQPTANNWSIYDDTNLISGDFDFSFTWTTKGNTAATTGIAVGFILNSATGSFTDSGTDYGLSTTNIPFKIINRVGQIDLYGNNASEATPTISNGDVIRIYRTGSTFYVEKNGSPLRTMTATSSADLRLAIGCNAPSSYDTIDNMGFAITSANPVHVSQTFTALSQPDTAFVPIWHEDVDACTPNTDFTVEVSRDAGTTWTAGTLALAATLGAAEILTCSIDISAQPAGTSMRWRFKFLNAKSQRLRGVAMQWS
jgi:hypothetical protein